MKRWLILIVMVAFVGCMSSKNYQRPHTDMPSQFNVERGVTDTLVNLRWWEIFPDTVLYRLITTALVQNKNVLTALSRIEQAQLTLKATRANFFPFFNYNASAFYGTYNSSAVKPKNPFELYALPIQVSWELDFFGRIRHQTAAAKSEYLASQAGLRAVYLSLIAGVAQSYFMILDYQQSLAISERTYRSRAESYALMLESFRAGVISELDLKQAETQMETAAAAIPQYRLAASQATHALSVLLGEYAVDTLTAPKTLDQWSMPDSLPVGIPSQLLTRRPDIVQSFYTIQAQNAQTAAAVAALFPQISLTAPAGLLSRDFTTLLRAKSFLWGVTGSVAGAIFNFGAKRRVVGVQREVARQAVLSYEQTVLSAFSEVKDALSQIEDNRLQYEAYQRVVEASRTASYLSKERYMSGFSNYLEVLDSDRDLFSAELQLSMVKAQWILGYVNLYKALGGGWISESEEHTAQPSKP